MPAKNLNELPLKTQSSPNFDLDAGFDTFDPKEGNERLEILLKWCEQMAPNGGNLKKALHGAQFVSWRGLLTKIGTTVYEQRDTWRFRALRVGDVIFLCEEETEQKKEQNANMDERGKHMTYWGFKFEQYMTLDDGMDLPETSTPVSTREEFATVMRTSIENAQPGQKPLELLYSAEVDCLDRDGKYVELKTHKGDLRGWFWSGSKSLKWWLQSFLVAIDYLVVGHRNDQGIVTKVSSIRTDQLQKHSQWYGGACIRLISQVLTRISETLKNDKEACVVEFKGSQVIHISKCAVDSCDFIPDDFQRKFK